MSVYLSVVIPCYNEAANLKRGVLKEVYDYLKSQKYTWEVIVSDDGPTDNTREILASEIKKYKNFRHLKNPHGGKPSALSYGIKAAKGEYLLFTDMDQSTPIAELGKLMPHAGEYKVVIGSRGLSRKNFSLYRQLGSVAFVWIRKAMLLRSINDTQCGFKLFEREVVSKTFPKLEFFESKERVSGWKVTSYDVELLHIISKMGVKIKEVVVRWQDEDKSSSKGGGVSRYARESREMLMQIFRVKARDMAGKYNV